MAYLINLPTFKDNSGTLTVVEKLIPFKVKRFFFIYDVKKLRGGHRHKKNTQALICVNGKSDIYLNNGIEENFFCLDRPNICLIVEKEDWHTMKIYKNSVLLVCASEFYDKNDYIDEEYIK